jgi:hypothetical protein
LDLRDYALPTMLGQATAQNLDQLFFLVGGKMVGGVQNFPEE